MPKLKKILRLLLLCLLAAAGFNGIMVFIFFDGTNFFTHQFYQGKAISDGHRYADYEKRVMHLEKRIKAVKRSEREKYKGREKMLNEKYQLLDKVIHGSHLIYRHPDLRENIGNKFGTDHPFKVENRVLTICAGKSCFYEENLPQYVNLGFFKDKNALQSRNLSPPWQSRQYGTFPLEFALVKKSGPFELWEAYWKTGDSAYGYYANYLVNIAQKRLLRRDVNIDREGVFMGEASASGRYLYLGHGCCPGVRGISVITAYGQSILDTTYMDKVSPSWKNDTLEFFSPVKEEVVGGNHCTRHGQPAYLSQRLRFIAGRIVRMDEKKVFCGQ